ncbi:LutB/LldF family L-lactate oxidation iron-sulfur protein [Helicobacter fennelliae]|uniref:Predicted L-lactate dehydrogenase, Iron-sulfur cluster-binding subunit YkgF n=2 Tax=Helicobacter fennelliae TaxID=215 RepID=T1CW31_9HELI|nr:LutB/LldF family L-lactate oxidation iron-sulfur protein [Helicobacter fennelliae]GAD18025.1 predicted L-lactate dehydrogenase, Iron-sulfur cluster-binding subunit YkgF [Helicobacter fennelliae MRY12-0050]SQB98156.1 putative iron-sulfur protein [Helicobacter fennelliae]STP06631.1 putative iron-sulfur protein [Helicobacter fennelliae]STQ83814.1 putative iron-sulfur protein [Helicobacter fennelliae]
MSDIQAHSNQTHSNYEEEVLQKLSDEQLRKNLKSCMTTLKTNRKNLITTRFTDWEGLRKKGRNVKLKALSQLDYLLEEFEKNATANGIKIHWASSPDDANEIIYNLAKQKNITKILKGKSMASEEIHLNAYLKKKGVEAVETDLGELIIQLIDEPPVHIVAPAIHKNRYQIGEIFKNKLNAPLESEPEKLNNIARVHLRKEFKDFKMGLSGVNFAIAKEGAVWLIENEGNGRMSTTACDVHVAICGIEKIVESFEDASILVSLLAPSAVGAPITAYNNIISSPRKEGEKDGPKEVHIIMLDNHRSNILADSKFYRALSCIRCGTCLNHCPVYDKIGGHAYLSTYPGPIGEVISPQLFGLKQYGYMVNLCSLCGRCSEVCPVQIPLAELIRDLRSEKAKEGRGLVYASEHITPNKKEQQAMKYFSMVATSPKQWRFALKFVHYFGNVGKVFAPLIPGLKQWSKYRDLPTINGNLDSKVKQLQGVIYE